MGHLQGVNRPAAMQFPEWRDDDIAADHPVRFIEAFVDDLAWEALGGQPARPATTGWPADHPAALLKRSNYGDLDQLRSSRRLAEATHRPVKLMGLVKQLWPDHQPMADVRRHNLVPVRPVCRERMWLCTQLDLRAGDLVAIDGSQFNAVNSTARHFTGRLVCWSERVTGSHWAMAHIKPTSSQAIATTTWLAFFPRAMRRRKRLHSCTCAFQLMSWIALSWWSSLSR